MSLGLAGDIVLILIAALLGGVVARLLGLPLILGYILAGVLVGPNTGGPTIAEIEDIELLADIGVALLLFSLGLEFPLRRLAPVRRVALLGTPLQIVLTISLGYGIASALGSGWVEAVWFGALLSLSSTAVVLKVLTVQEVSGTLASRVMVGMLLAQDLALVPLMTILPALNDLGAGIGPLGTAVIKAALFLGAMFVLGVRLLPRLMERIVSWNSRELFLVSTAAIGLGVGYATYLVGLSFAFGAFLAGMVLSESTYSHQALADIGPLRDLFTMVFFVSVGMLIVPSFLWERAWVVGAVLVVTALGKGAIFSGVTRLFGYRNIVPLAAGLGLFQVGEFSFVLARAGLDTGGLSRDLYSLFLAVATLGMALTPLIARQAGPIYGWWRRRRPATTLEAVALGETNLEDHVIIGGYGRVGSFVAGLIQGLGRPFVVIDLDPKRVETAEKEGVKVVYGDVAAAPVLKAAGVGRARLVLLTVPNPVSARLAVEHIRRANSAVHIVARTASREQLDDLGRLGVYEVVEPELEAGLEMARQALAHLGAGVLELQVMTEAVRRKHYQAITGGGPTDEAPDRELVSTLRLIGRAVDIERLAVEDGSRAAGRTIGGLDVRRTTGAVVIAVVRGGELIANPGADVVLEPGDVLAVLGTASQRRAFASLIDPGLG